MERRDTIQNSRILIVDDEPANVLLLERILQQAGYANFSKTNDPREVLEFFTVYKPDLILLDLMMPNVDGYALLTQLRSRIPDNHYLPILVLTADVSAKARQHALSLGAKDFLTKPFDASEVLLRVSNLLETRWISVELHEQIRCWRSSCNHKVILRDNRWIMRRGATGVDHTRDLRTLRK